MDKQEKLYRQGDVLLISTTNTPATKAEIPQEDGATVLAHGEITGHRHRFDGKGTCLLKIAGTEDRLLITSFPVARLIHEEHEEIGIPGGKYIVRIQEEWTKMGASRVED